MRDRLPADFVQMHPGRIEIEIEMEVDIEIEFVGDRKNAGNLIAGLGVGIGTAADQIGTVPAGLDQELVGTGIVEQAFLREDANFEIDRPGIIVFQLLDRIETAQPDARIDLHMRAHARRTLQDRFFERALRARIDVFFGKVALGRRDRGDGVIERAAFGPATIENAGFVEMNMRFDKSGQHQPAADILARAMNPAIAFRSPRCSPSLITDIDACLLATRDAAMAQDKIEGHRYCAACARPR